MASSPASKSCIFNSSHGRQTSQTLIGMIKGSSYCILHLLVWRSLPIRQPGQKLELCICKHQKWDLWATPVTNENKKVRRKCWKLSAWAWVVKYVIDDIFAVKMYCNNCSFPKQTKLRVRHNMNSSTPSRIHFYAHWSLINIIMKTDKLVNEEIYPTKSTKD